MKKVILLLLCLSGMTAMAQKGERQQRSSENEMTPEQSSTLQTKKMTLALDLNEAQQKQIQNLNLENAKYRRTKQDERETRKKDEDAKKPTSDERYAMMNERLDRMIALKAEMKDILSEEQYNEWEKMTKKEGDRPEKKDGNRKGRARK